MKFSKVYNLHTEFYCLKYRKETRRKTHQWIINLQAERRGEDHRFCAKVEYGLNLLITRIRNCVIVIVVCFVQKTMICSYKFTIQLRKIHPFVRFANAKLCAANSLCATNQKWHGQCKSQIKRTFCKAASSVVLVQCRFMTNERAPFNLFRFIKY